MKRPRVLPTFYYLTHFNEFLKFVKQPCAALLDSADLDFITQFENLDKNAQCTLVRACNRKYQFIKIDSLYYPEIEHTQASLKTLINLNYMRALSLDDIDQWVSTLTKPEIIEILSAQTQASLCYKASWPKAKLLEALSNVPPTVIYQNDICKSYVVRNTDHYIDYFLYLYFGNCHSKLNQFSMRDLGVMRTRKEQAQVMARFSSLQSAKCTYALHKRLSALKESPLLAHQQIINTLNDLPIAQGQRAEELKNRIQFLLANQLLQHDIQAAVDILSEIETPEAQEKWIRESYKLGNKKAVEAKLEDMIDHPLSDDSLAFAGDFLARKYKKKRTSVLTDMLRDDSQLIALDEMHKTGVEKGVVGLYKNKGLFAQRTENELFRSLFGLFFWEEIFEIEGFGLVNEFDRTPLSLKKDCLYEIAHIDIERKIAQIKNNQQLMQFISKQAVKHFGKPNDIFRWKERLLELIKPFLEHSPHQAVLNHLREMTKNWSQLNDGYPDILVIDSTVTKSELRFEEIKSEGDQLRRNQLTTIQKLKEHGFDVRITNVEWTIDPMQAYVVVDIETTGGRAANHKITEVGMVKMVNGEIIDSWQSLINPQRRIPANITSLTGIDNDMVRHAPIFAEVAQEIADFTEDCVFVAHNVNFDYGFIREEFARLERHFKRPKLCTVSQMRKYYKGLPSYSLANLTKHFDISMQRHHRAMSDAIAASELLKLINEKRIPKS
jgi:DNA polymerase-3 subunit epsilon